MSETEIFDVNEIFNQSITETKPFMRRGNHSKTNAKNVDKIQNVSQQSNLLEF